MVQLRSVRCGSAGTVSGSSSKRSSRRSSTPATKVLIAVRYRGRGRASGVEVNDRVFEVHTFRDSRCVRKVDFQTRAEALEAAGLSE